MCVSGVYSPHTNRVDAKVLRGLQLDVHLGTRLSIHRSTIGGEPCVLKLLTSLTQGEGKLGYGDTAMGETT